MSIFINNITFCKGNGLLCMNVNIQKGHDYRTYNVFETKIDRTDNNSDASIIVEHVTILKKLFDDKKKELSSFKFQFEEES